MRKEIYFGLNVKIIVVISSIIIFTSIILNCFFVARQTFILRNFVEERIGVVVKSFAASSEYAITSPSQSMEFLYHLGKNCLKEKNVIYSAVYDSEGLPLTIQTNAKENESIQKYVDSTPVDVVTIQKLKDTGIQKNIIKISSIGEVLDVIAPVMFMEFNTNISKSKKEKFVGVVRIGAELNDINYQIKKAVKFSVLITAIIVFVGVFLSFFIVKIIVKSIEKENGIKK